jgi:outer membrane lipoprotein carrier protein
MGNFIKSLLFIILIFNLQSLYAQKGKDAETILKELTEKTKSYKTIKVDFTYNMDNPDAKIHESEKGTLLLEGDKYRLNIAGQTVISNGKTSWTYISDANEIQVNTVEDNEDAITPNKLLSSYYENYKSKLIGEESKGGQTYQIIELKPSEDKSYSRIELTINKELKRIAKIAIQDKNGNTFSYIVNDFKPDVPVKASDFTFDPKEFPGAEVIDMR